MKLLRASALVLVAALASAAPARQTPPTEKAPELYPPVKHATAVYAFGLPDDIKADVVRKSLAELATKEAECTVRYGPVKSAARPQKAFVIVEAPASVDVKDLIKALKKGAASAEAMAWTCFESSDKTLGRGLGAGMQGLSPRDFILGISNDLRWVEAGGGFSEFFFAPGKLDAEFIQDRFHKMAQPFGIKDVGALVTETISWPLSGPIDLATAKRVEKDVAKIAGVKSVKLDIEKQALEVKVVLDGLVRSGPPMTMPGADALGGGGAIADAAPRMRFDTNSLFTVLDKEKVTVSAPAKESEGQGGK